jgi:hypothetical protein
MKSLNPYQNIRNTSETDNDAYEASLEIFWKYLENGD